MGVEGWRNVKYFSSNNEHAVRLHKRQTDSIFVICTRYISRHINEETAHIEMDLVEV
jgi:hypothetical protein